MAVRAVFFDAGGTILRLRRGVGEEYRDCAARFGVRADAASLESDFRRAFRAAPPLAFPGALPGEIPTLERRWWAAIVRQVFSAYRFGDFEAFFGRLYEELGRASAWELYADVRPTLHHLRRRGVRLGVISNFDSRLFGILKGLAIDGAFESITLSSLVGAAKPDPVIFRAALDRHGVGAHEALHVGDSDREDVAGARAAGLRALRVDGGIAATLAHV